MNAVGHKQAPQAQDVESKNAESTEHKRVAQQKCALRDKLQSLVEFNDGVQAGVEFWQDKQGRLTAQGGISIEGGRQRIEGFLANAEVMELDEDLDDVRITVTFDQLDLHGAEGLLQAIFEGGVQAKPSVTINMPFECKVGDDEKALNAFISAGQLKDQKAKKSKKPKRKKSKVQKPAAKKKSNAKNKKK